MQQRRNILSIFVLSIGILSLSALPTFGQHLLKIDRSAPILVPPSATDAEIVEFDVPHLAWLPDRKLLKHRGQLIVFLGGTNQYPEAMTAFAHTGSALGYHVVSLMYPNTISPRTFSESADPAAFLRMRTAVIRGGTYPPVVISRSDCIENRLVKLLAYLRMHRRNEGWDQYFDATGKIRWDKIILSGFSQGGGHAYLMAKSHSCARVLLFAAPKDFSLHFKRPADEYDENSATPLNRYYMFTNVLDDIGCNHAQQMQILGLTGQLRYGVADADKPPATFGHAHTLFTKQRGAGWTALHYHGSVISPGLVPLSFLGPVWTHMLTDPINSGAETDSMKPVPLSKKEQRLLKHQEKKLQRLEKMQRKN